MPAPEGDGQGSANGTMRVSNGSRAADELPTTSSSNSRTLKTSSESTNGLARNGKGLVEGPPRNYFGHAPEEVTRILIQALADMGYHDAAESVTRSSGYELENPTVAAFRNAVLNGSWSEAEALLSSNVVTGDRQHPGDGLVLAPGADRDTMRLWLRQQKFLELLEKRDNHQALAVLRSELTPLCSGQHQKLNLLAGLLMCPSVEHLKQKAAWDGAQGRSRQILLSELSRCISPSVMLPEHRLAVLLEQVKQSQISNCLYHTSSEPPSLYSDHLCDRTRFPSEVLVELVNQDQQEVWQVRFSNNGSRLASCGMDQNVYIYAVPSFEVLHRIVAHEGSDVCNIAWSPDDKTLITCGKDRYAKIWNTETGDCMRVLDRFDEPVSSCVWTPNGQSFVTGSFDKTKSICQWNLNGERLFILTRKHRTEDLSLSPDGRWLIAMDEQQRIHVYDFVTREYLYEVELKARATSLSISQDSRFLLVNKVDGEAQLIDIASRDVVQKYHGHSGGGYTIRSTFGGANESFVVSGSEDGSMCIWHKSTGIQVERVAAHDPRCNAVSWNPADPCMVASCGDDGKIKM
ncbi:WD domain-containing protein [Lasiosphaeria ovina]|uniref:WD domain-containing protein n=1 Tax=Lasiosphaeria ovina TaxID=92902 RepID=A0AAE0JWS9_9PEZI|nr:WD domain-containing protein [Lasiosphaeria ovina]